jgi:hypothetical protein
MEPTLKNIFKSLDTLRNCVMLVSIIYGAFIIWLAVRIQKVEKKLSKLSPKQS